MGHMGNWELDLATQAITWSDELFRMFGLDLAGSEPTFAEIFRYIHGEDRDRLRQNLRRIAINGGDCHLELKIVRANGSVGYVDTRSKAHR